MNSTIQNKFNQLPVASNLINGRRYLVKGLSGHYFLVICKPGPSLFAQYHIPEFGSPVKVEFGCLLTPMDYLHKAGRIKELPALVNTELRSNDIFEVGGVSYRAKGINATGRKIQAKPLDSDEDIDVDTEDFLVNSKIIEKAKETEAGGFLIGEKDGTMVAHNNADMGGLLVGNRHTETGIKGVNDSNGQYTEVEDAEAVVNSRGANDEKPKQFNGKQMTNKEILSELNQDGGGVAFGKGGATSDIKSNGAGDDLHYKGGEVILTRNAVANPKKYSYQGKMMTTKEIASAINVESGGVAFGDGGDVPEKISCGCNHYEIGGSVCSMNEFIAISESDYGNRLRDGIEKERQDHYNTLSELNAGAITIEDALVQIAEKEIEIDPTYPYK